MTPREPLTLDPEAGATQPTSAAPLTAPESREQKGSEQRVGRKPRIASREHVVSLGDQERRDLLEAARGISYHQCDTSQDEVSLRRLLLRSARMPQSLARVLDDFVASEEAYLWIEGLPEEQINEVFLMVTHRVGHPFAHIDEGRLVMKVKPKKHDTSQKVTSFFTWNCFPLHTELPYIHVPPSFIALRCVHNLPGAYTYVSSLTRALRSVSEEHRAELRKRQFHIPVPPHFRGSRKDVPKRRVLNRDGRHHHLRVRFDSVEADNELARESLEALSAAMNDEREAIELQPRDLLIINNRRAAHGRAQFQPTFSDNDRELRRVYLAADLEPYGDRYDPDTRRVHGF